jgi:ferredoxin
MAEVPASGGQIPVAPAADGDGNGGPAHTQEFIAEWRNAAYNCFSSGHKFCREVCSVTQVTRNDTWTPTAFHATVVAMEQGELTVEDIAADYVNCTGCGVCELRCPNTLFTGDFYRFRTRPVDLVNAVRALAVDSGVHQPAWQRWNQLTDERTHEPVLGDAGVSPEHVRDCLAGEGVHRDVTGRRRHRRRAAASPARRGDARIQVIPVTVAGPVSRRRGARG